MAYLDILAYWLGWADMVALAALSVGAGLPSRPGRAPPGVWRLLFYGVGVVCYRHDLHPAIGLRLHGLGYRNIGWGRWRLGVALPMRQVRSRDRAARADF
ncbi:hypothetical protein [Xylophilus sp. GOD-11R]|uniref:hypothetical protein n=1 Tax=Xylophilus sp. GOD-11R TaxID=3089814 RepID=UPI00298D4767|nr:hypothetical protein [Xylophilus sp. GOD-11R]WPB55263.1 hypothetical protein R9X41_14010 [Xylophilus sp. GOD-11R]